MKKTIILAVILVVGSLTACVTPEDDDIDGEDESSAISSVSVNGLNTFYLPTDVIDWDSISLTLTLNDKKSSEVTLTKGEFDVDKPTSEETEFILNTSGLYTYNKNETIIPEADYPISYYFVYEEVEYSGDLSSVAVTEYPSTLYEVYYFLEPEFVTTYKANLGRVDDSDEASEDAYYEACDYTVGDDNPFKFKPLLRLFDKNLNVVDPDNYAVDVALYLEPDDENGRAVDVISDSEYVSYSNFEFQFTEKAVGHTFTIEMNLEYFTRDISNNPIGAITFTFNVEDGYNAYSGLDLDMINAAPSELIEGWTYNYGSQTYQNQYSGHSIYYDPNGAISSSSTGYIRFPYVYVWDEFFTNVHPEMDAHYVKGIYMHNNISISMDDFPDCYKISEEEAKDTESGSTQHEDLSNTMVVGSLRDEVYLYNHFMADDFTFNGNLFTLDCSNIMWTRSYVTGNGSNSLTFFTDEQENAAQGNARVFCFNGRNVTYNSDYRTESDEDGETAYLLNLNAKGNLDLEGTGANFNRFENKEENFINSCRAGSIMFCISESTHTVVNNVICKEYLIGLYASHANENYTCLEINHSKVFDCYAAGVYSYFGGITTISNSTLKRFGAPATMAISGSGYHEGFYMSAFKLDNVIIENTLQGDEYFFVSFNISWVANLIKEFDAFFNGGDVSWVSEYLGDYSSYLGDDVTYSSTDYEKTILTSYTGKSIEESQALNVLYAGTDRYIGTESGSTQLYLDYQSSSGGDFLIDYRDPTSEGNLASVIEQFYEYSGISLGGALPLFITNTGKIFTVGIEIYAKLSYSDGKLSYSTTVNSYLYDVADALASDSPESEKMIDVSVTGLGNGPHKIERLTEDDTDLMIYYREGNMAIAVVVSLYDTAE